MYCNKLKKEINAEECYECFLRTGVYPRLNLCKKINMLPVTPGNEANFNMI